MKSTLYTLAAILALLASCLVLRAADAPPANSGIGVDNLTFDGQTFYLASSGPTKTGTIREYLLKGETFDHWTKLLGIFTYSNQTDPDRAIETLDHVVKQANPQAKSFLVHNPTTGEAMIDFITWPTSNATNVPFAEFNIFKYRKLPSGGLISFQYAQRAYGDDTVPFIKSLKEERIRLDRLAADYQIANPQ